MWTSILHVKTQKSLLHFNTWKRFCNCSFSAVWMSESARRSKLVTLSACHYPYNQSKMHPLWLINASCWHFHSDWSKATPHEQGDKSLPCLCLSHAYPHKHPVKHMVNLGVLLCQQHHHSPSHPRLHGDRLRSCLAVYHCESAQTKN